MILFKQLREKYSMSSKKMLTAINIICFIIFVLIQSLLFFLKILDYSLDGSRNGLDDVIFYIGTYLLTSIIYLIPQAFIILQGKKQKSKPSSFSKAYKIRNRKTAITYFYFHLPSSIIHKTKSPKGHNKQNFTFLN